MSTKTKGGLPKNLGEGTRNLFVGDPLDGVVKVDKLYVKGLAGGADAPEGYGEINSNVQKYSPMMFYATDPDFIVTGTMGNPIIEYNQIAPDGRKAVKVTINAASRIKFDKLTGMQFSGEMFAEIYGSRTLTNLNEVQLECYEVIGAGEKGWRSVRPTITDPLNNSVEQGGPICVHYGAHTPLTAFGTSPSNTFKVAQYTLRVQPVSGTAVFYIYSVGLTSPKRKSRIAVVFDDGWISCATLGAEPLLRRGIPFTQAVIPSLVDAGAANYMTKDQLKCLINQGCSVIAHGPIGGTGNLIDNYKDDLNPIQSIVDDVKYTIDWIKTNQLLTPGADSCYIWPMGKFQFAINDLTVLNAIYNIGIKNGRSTLNVNQNTLRGSFDCQTKYGRLVMPIIGHEASSTLADEPANIAAIVNKINSFSNAGGIDMHLMLHKVMRDEDATDSNRSITILLSHLNQIADAIKTNVDAGKLEVVLMQNM